MPPLPSGVFQFISNDFNGVSHYVFLQVYVEDLLREVADTGWGLWALEVYLKAWSTWG